MIKASILTLKVSITIRLQSLLIACLMIGIFVNFSFAKQCFSFNSLMHLNIVDYTCRWV